MDPFVTYYLLLPPPLNALRTATKAQFEPRYSVSITTENQTIDEAGSMTIYDFPVLAIM